MEQIRRELCGHQNSVHSQAYVENIGNHEHDKTIHVYGLRTLAFLSYFAGHFFECIQAQFRMLHIVNGHTQTEKEDYVEYGVRYDEPLFGLAVKHAHYVDENAEGQKKEDFLRAWMYIRMPRLIQFDRAYDTDYIHETGVELEVVITRTYVVGCAQYAFHNQTDAHRVE